MIPSEKSMHALQRFGLGARPGDLARVQGDPVGAVLAEVSKPRIVNFSKAGLLSTSQAIDALEVYTAARRKRMAAEPKPAEDGGSMNTPKRRGKDMMKPARDGGGAEGGPQV